MPLIIISSVSSIIKRVTGTREKKWSWPSQVDYLLSFMRLLIVLYIEHGTVRISEEVRMLVGFEVLSIGVCLICKGNE